ncbi:MAG: PorT family protein [Bacteroidales bacterium]|nr:PorT family protein [Bacteroidales bacterium]
MKYIIVMLSIVALFGYSLPGYPQKFTTGLMSGVNFSNLHGELTTGKWQAKPGPVSGIFFNYSFKGLLSFQTELDFTALSYDYKGYQYQPSNNYLIPFKQSIIDHPPSWEKWDFSFYRIPIYVKFTTPTRFQFELSAGVYFSFLGNYDYSGGIPYINYPLSSSVYSYPEYNPEPSKHDFGYFFSTGVSYPLNKNFHVYLNGRYFYGRRNFIKTVNGKNGATELTFGIGYSGLFKNNKKLNPENSGKDPPEQRMFLKVRGGLNLSRNIGDQHNNSYSVRNGFSTGISLVYRYNENSSLQTDVLFERKGYKMQDSSDFYFRYVPGDYPIDEVDTKIDIDYLLIPLLYNARFGNPVSFYFNTGPYAGLNLNARCTGIAINEYSRDNRYTLIETHVYDDIEGYIKDIDWGWVLGGGIQFPVFGRYKLDIEFRYNYGLINIFDPLDKNQRAKFNEDNTIKNESFNLMVGLQIPVY